MGTLNVEVSNDHLDRGREEELPELHPQGRGQVLVAEDLVHQTTQFPLNCPELRRNRTARRPLLVLEPLHELLEAAQEELVRVGLVV